MKIYASDSGFIGKNILIVGLLVVSDHVTITNLPFDEPFAAREARGTKTPCWRVSLSRSQSFICSSAGFVVSCHCLAANCPWTGKERFGEHVYHLHLSCSVVLEICGRIMTNYSFETKYENCFVNLE